MVESALPCLSAVVRPSDWLITRVLCDEASHTTLTIAGPFYHILPIPTRTVGACTHGRWAERHQGGGGVSGQKSNAQKSMPSLSLMQKGRKRPICSAPLLYDADSLPTCCCLSENQANKAFFSKQPHEKCTKTS